MSYCDLIHERQQKSCFLLMDFITELKRNLHVIDTESTKVKDITTLTRSRMHRFQGVGLPLSSTFDLVPDYTQLLYKVFAYLRPRCHTYTQSDQHARKYWSSYKILYVFVVIYKHIILDTSSLSHRKVNVKNNSYKLSHLEQR